MKLTIIGPDNSRLIENIANGKKQNSSTKKKFCNKSIQGVLVTISYKAEFLETRLKEPEQKLMRVMNITIIQNNKTNFFNKNTYHF